MFRTCKVGVVRLVKIGPLNFAFCSSRQQHAMQDITPYAACPGQRQRRDAAPRPFGLTSATPSTRNYAPRRFENENRTVIHIHRRRTRERWALAILQPGGRAETSTTYCSRKIAIETARMLAGDNGCVRVCQ